MRMIMNSIIFPLFLLASLVEADKDAAADIHIQQSRLTPRHHHYDGQTKHLRQSPRRRNPRNDDNGQQQPRNNSNTNKKKRGKKKKKKRRKKKNKKNNDSNKSPSASGFASGGKNQQKPTTETDGGSSNSNSNSVAKQTLSILYSVSETIDNSLFLYEKSVGVWEPSSVYNFDGLYKALQVMNTNGVAGMHYYLGDVPLDDDDNNNNGYKYGLTNVAAFLAQSMKETIKYDACSENNWDFVFPIGYPLSNACGQLGQSYQDYTCPPGEEHMQCEVDLNMEITAATHAKWHGAPAPLFCKPKKDKNDFTGRWDYAAFCNKPYPWYDPPEYCEVYPGQVAGAFNNTEPVPNRAGRTDVEGCCWWGRGVIQTTGICNFGKLNYYLGAHAKREGRDTPYGNIDFCKDPEIICSSEEYTELKWIAGMLYWMESVQQYDVDGWNYMDELHKFVDGGFAGSAFIDAVSGIVNRGCHNPPCGTGNVDGGPERAMNFNKALGVLNVH